MPYMPRKKKWLITLSPLRLCGKSSILLLVSLGSLFGEGDSVQDKLCLIPEAERRQLEWFFRSLVSVDGWGYALFGTKAVALSGYFSVEPIDNIMCWYGASFMKRGWEVWEKYEFLFPHPRYIFDKESYKPNLWSFYLINKDNAINVINKYERLFQEEIEGFCDAGRVLKTIEANHSLYTSLSRHEGLLGIMLGFGPESSFNYYKRDLVFEGRGPVCLNNCLLEEVSYQTHEKAPYIKIRSIAFMGNPLSREAQAILKQNRQERKMILKQYSQGNFLEITLKKLMEN